MVGAVDEHGCHLPSVGLSETDDGLIFEHIDPDEAELLYHEIFEQRCYAPLAPVTRAEPLILDVGANVGLFCFWALREWPSSHIVCFEPVPPILETLRRNLCSVAGHARSGELGLPRAVAVPVALGEAEGAGTFHFFPWAPGESTRHPQEAASQRQLVDAAAAAAGLAPPPRHGRDTAYECSVQTLQRTLRGLEAACSQRLRIDLLKIDVEGDEEAVLRGLGDAGWACIDQVVMEVRDVHGRLARVLRLLEEAGLGVIDSRQQEPVASEGYCAFVPRALKLFHVRAARAGVPSLGSAVGRRVPGSGCECGRRHRRKRRCLDV